MPYAERLHENSFHYVLRHGISIAVAGVLAYAVYRVPLNVWFNNTFPLWILTILLLAAVLVVGTEVNGSTRWIRVAGFTLQASEVAKVMMAIFTADYVVRRAEEVRNNIKGLIRLGIIMLLTVGLIIAEPDLGATVVISLMMLGIFFLAGEV
jgi:cell division protein FtsW